MKNISQDIKLIEKEIEEINNKIVQMGDMQEKERIIKQIDNLYFSLDEKTFCVKNWFVYQKVLRLVKIAITNDKKILEEAKDLEKKEQKLSEFENIVTKAKELMKCRNRLMTIVNRINERKQTIAESKKIMQKYKILIKKKWS